MCVLLRPTMVEPLLYVSPLGDGIMYFCVNHRGPAQEVEQSKISL